MQNLKMFKPFSHLLMVLETTLLVKLTGCFDSDHNQNTQHLE